MRRARRAGIIALCLAFAASSARASPGARQVTCQVRLQVSAQAAFDEPWARWMNQFGDMLRLNCGAAEWSEGRVLSLEGYVGNRRALAMRLVSSGGERYLTTSLLEGRLRLGEKDTWAEPFARLTDEILALPPAGRLIPVSGAELGLKMSACATRLRAMAAGTRSREPCENCGKCETCRLCELAEGVAALVDAAGDRFDAAASEENVLLIDADCYDEDALLPVSVGGARDAPDDLGVRLVREALIALRDALIGQTD